MLMLRPPVMGPFPGKLPTLPKKSLVAGIVTISFTSAEKELTDILNTSISCQFGEEKIRMPTDLVDMITMYVIPPTTSHPESLMEYASISINTAKMVHDESYQTMKFNSELAQAFAGYSNHTPYSLPPTTDMTTTSSHCWDSDAEWQKVVTDSVVTSSKNMTHVHDLDRVLCVDNVHFTKRGLLAMGPNVLPPCDREPQTTTINGCLLVEQAGCGKESTVINALKELQDSKSVSSSSPPPIDRKKVRAMVILTSPGSLPKWKQAVDQLQPNWTVVVVTDGKSLNGLSSRIDTVDLVLISNAIFILTRKLFKGFFSSSFNGPQSWAVDQQFLWETLFHIVVVDDAHTLIPRTFAESKYKPDVCLLDRNAIIVKTLIQGEFTILFSNRVPQKKDLLDTYLYLLNASSYPTDIMNTRTLMMNMTKTGPLGGTFLQSFPLSSSVKDTNHEMFYRHHVFFHGGGFSPYRETTYLDLTYFESAQIKAVSSWMGFLTENLLDLGDDDVPFLNQSRQLILETPSFRDLFDEDLPLLLLQDEDEEFILGDLWVSRKVIINYDMDLVCDKMNRLEISVGLSPFQKAATRLIVNIMKSAYYPPQIIIYSEVVPNVFKNILTQLKEFDIDLVFLSSDTSSSVEQKRKVVVIPVGYYQDFTGPHYDATHLLVLGHVKDHSEYTQCLRHVQMQTVCGKGLSSSSLEIVTISPI